MIQSVIEQGEIERVKWFGDEKEDAGIQTTADSKFHGISAGFDSFSNEGKNLIIQYQAKYEKDIECGGGYVKIGPKLEDGKAFGDPTEYNIMFGPDKCGYTKRTHLIFNYKGKNVLKKSDLAYKQDDFGISHLYSVEMKRKMNFNKMAQWNQFSHMLHAVDFDYKMCGGGYVKIGPKLEDGKAFGDPTEFNIMFGPV